MLRLKELRESKNLNQEGLALKLNVSQSTISAYEIGERTPDLEMLISIANLFDTSIDYIVGLSDTKKIITENILPPTEIEYLLKYRKANHLNQEKIKSYMDGLLS